MRNVCVMLKRFRSSVLVALCVITLFHVYVLLSVQAVSTYPMAQNDPRVPNLQDIATPFGLPLSGIYKR